MLTLSAPTHAPMLRPALLAALVGAARALVGPGDLGVCTAQLTEAQCQALADAAGFETLVAMPGAAANMAFSVDSATQPPGCHVVDHTHPANVDSPLYISWGWEDGWYWNAATHAESNSTCGASNIMDVTCYCGDEAVLADWGQTCADIHREDLVTPLQCDYAYQLLQEEWGNADEFPDTRPTCRSRAGLPM